LPALRLALAANDSERAVDLLFRHIWEQGLAGDSTDALAAIATQLGIEDLPAALANDDIKQALSDNGAKAVALGVFGVPTLVIDDQLFWGNDATELALQYLASPSLFDDPEMRRLDELPVGVQRPGARA
jgi:2-hydroxychromene-2-carboxylate isomerase